MNDKYDEPNEKVCELVSCNEVNIKHFFFVKIKNYLGLMIFWDLVNYS